MRDRIGEYRYLYDGDEIRIVIADDVLCIPGHAGVAGWSMGGFGATIDETWLLSEGRLPGSAGRRRALASMLVRAVRAHHGGAAEAVGDGRVVPRGPFVHCPTCTGSGVSGFVVKCDCANCHGTGTDAPGFACGECKGTGRAAR